MKKLILAVACLMIAVDVNAKGSSYEDGYVDAPAVSKPCLIKLNETTYINANNIGVIDFNFNTLNIHAGRETVRLLVAPADVPAYVANLTRVIQDNCK